MEDVAKDRGELRRRAAAMGEYVCLSASGQPYFTLSEPFYKSWGEVQGQQQECFICRPDGEPFIDGELDKQFPQELLPTCGREPPMRKTCPPLYTKGCLTQRRGARILSKMCSGVEVSECQEANDVNYCYCKGNLCNEEVIPTTTLAPENDDEDLSSEGSGEGVTQPSTTTVQPIEKHATTPTISSSSLAVPSLLLFVTSLTYFVL